ncbi:MAG: hypothetical protein ABI343_18050 [Burkholderiaceae bacterium]
MNESKLKSDLDAIFAPSDLPEDQDTPPLALGVEDSEEAFLQAFYVVQDEVLLPAFSEVGEYVKQRGFAYRIDTHVQGSNPDGQPEVPQVTLRLLIGDGSRHTQDYEFPHFKVLCDPAGRKLIFHQSTIWTGHGGTSGTLGQFRLEDATAQMVRDKLVEFVRELYIKS